MPCLPESGLVIARARWHWLCQGLCERSSKGHESGAFLLGRTDVAVRHVEDVVYYDALDPNACASGIVELDASAFTLLWKLCDERGLQVVADVHTHPHSARQSWIDRANPMIALRGHVALILPRFARGRVRMWSVGIYEYLGDHRWHAHGGCGQRFLHLGDNP
jgi:proteasome lid subunit RPN8/RPN11